MLKEFFEIFFAELPESKDYEFRFKIYGEWKRKSLTSEEYCRLMETFVYDFGEPLKNMLVIPKSPNP